MFTAQRTPSGAQNQSKGLTLVNREVVDGKKIPGFDHQTAPFIERSLMANRNSIIRIIPGVGDDGRILGTLKEGYDPKQATKDFASCLSDTFCCAATIQPFGSQWRDAVLTAYPPNSPEELERVESGKASVLEKFARVVSFCTDSQKKGRRPMQAHPDWFKWTALKGGTLGKVKYRFMMQAIMFQISDRFFEFEDQNTGEKSVKQMVGLVGVDQSASIQEFMEALVMPRDISKAPDPFTNSNLGPVAEVDGIWCYIHTENTPNDATGAKYKLFPRYYPVGQDPTYKSTPCPLTEDWIRQVWVPWDKLLRWYSREEQFYLIADTFGPDTVNYFFEALNEDEYTSFIPVDIRKKGYGRYNGMLGRTPVISGGYGAAVKDEIPMGMAPSVTAPSVAEPVAVAPAIVPPVMGPAEAPKAAVPGAMRVSDIVKESTPEVPHVTKKEEKHILPPQVQALMKDAMEQGVTVIGGAPGFGLPPVPPVPDDDKVDLDDIVPTAED